MRDDERDDPPVEKTPGEIVVDNLRVFQPRRPRDRAVLRQLTPEDLQRLTALVDEYGLG